MILDKKQKEIVESDSKDILVIAGAGSGKTRVLVERVRHLIEVKKVEPQELICVTFTNAAADEMRERLQDVQGISDAFIGTIHSFANRIYKESGETYQLLTTEVEMRLMKEILSDNEFIHLTYDKFLEYLDTISEIEKGNEDPALEDPYNYFTPSELSNWMEAQKRMGSLRKERGIITFDELLDRTREYFATLDTDVQHVMLDEAQDVGLREYQFVSGLDSKNTFIVGDDWQNIYSWKGADVSIFKNIAEDPNVTVYKMENNYRSAESIVAFSRSIIKQVPDRIEKKVNIVSDLKGSVKVDSKYKVDEYLKEIAENPDEFNDWFVLCRTNSDVYTISNKLREMNVPVDTFKRSNLTKEEMELRMALPTVKVITVHTAKGLENKNVLVYGNFPLKLASWQKSKSNFEERRVFYVAASRAEENLIVLN